MVSLRTWAMLVLLLVSSATTILAQTADEPDLGVIEVKITGQEPQWIDGAPHDSSVQVTIENQGNARSTDGYRIDYQWVKNGDVSWLNGEEEESIDFHAPVSTGADGPTQGSALDPGDQRQHDIAWRLQPGQAGHGTIRVTITPVGRDAGDANDQGESLLQFIEDHRLVVVPVEEGAIPLRPDQIDFVRIWIDNQGNVEEHVQPKIQDATGNHERLDAEWSPTALETTGFTVTAGKRAAATLLVGFPFSQSGDDRPFAVSYDLQFHRSYDETVVAVTTPTFYLLDEPMIPGSPFSVSVKGAQELAAHPGNSRSTTISVTNEGTSRDTYAIEAQTPDAGWSATVSPARLALDPGETQEAVVMALFPEELPLGTTSRLDVMVQSNRDQVLGVEPVQRTVKLRIHGPAVHIVPGPNFPAHAYTDDPRSLPITLLNTGDAATPSATVSVTADGPTGSTTRSVPMAPIPAGSSATIDVDLGSHPLTGSVTEVRAEWLPTETTEPGVFSQAMTKTIQVRDVRLLLGAPPETEAVAGQTLAQRAAGHTFHVTNQGNALEDFRVSLTASVGQPELALDSDLIRIAPGEGRSIPYDLALPEKTHQVENVTVGLTVAVDGRPDMRWTVNATTRISDESPPSITLRKSWPDDWSRGTPLRLDVYIDDSSSVATAEVEHLHIDDGREGRATLFEADGSWSNTLLLPDYGTYAFVVHATDHFGNHANVTLPEVTVIEPEPPSIQFLAMEPDMNVTRDQLIPIQVVDERPVTVVAHIEWQDQTRTLDVPLDASGNGTFHVGNTTPGPVRIHVVATNDIGSMGHAWLNLTVRNGTSGLLNGNGTVGQREAPLPGVFLVLVAVLGPSVAYRRSKDQQHRTSNGQQRSLWQASSLSWMVGVFRIAMARGGHFTRAVKRTAVALALAAIIVTGTLLVVIPPAPSVPIVSATEGASEADKSSKLRADLNQLWSQLPEEMDPYLAFGDAASILFAQTPDGMAIRDAPRDGTELAKRFLATDEQIPIPEAPATQEPLLDAIASLGDQADLPSDAVLRAKIGALRLAPATEDALARLVLSYGQALRLEAEATADFTEIERSLLYGDALAWTRWRAEHPERTDEDARLHRDELRGRADVTKRLQAADLLVRTVDATKAAMALPPVEPDVAVGPDTVLAGDLGHAMDSWEVIDALVRLPQGAAAARPLPELAHENLSEALLHLADTLGIPRQLSSSWAMPQLPPSLDYALAEIVTARWTGLQSGDATLHTQLLVDATRRSEPALRAWGAILSMDASESLNSFESASRVLESARSGAFSPSTLIGADLARGQGVAPVTPATLQGLLVRRGVPERDAFAASIRLPPEATMALALILTASQALDGALTEHGAEAQAELREAEEMQGLLEASHWTDAEARRIQAWAEQEHDLAALRAIQLAQAVALASIEAAATILKTAQLTEETTASSQDATPQPVDDVVGLVPGAGPNIASASSTVPCTQSPLSDCANDILLYVPAAGGAPGILVTGEGASTLTNQMFSPDPAPRIVIDLGGDDTYEISVGTGIESARLGVLLDVDGDDRYDSDRPLDHGAARGMGTLGVLWDLRGDDTYHHLPDATTTNGAQGFGADGGIGVLVDGDGTDTYHASRATAHGSAGIEGPGLPGDGIIVWEAYPSPDIVGAGMLLDLGVGDDEFWAAMGQGYAGTDYARAILVNEKGVSTYRTQLTNPWFQGGVGPATTAALATLLDLGGEGTTYSSQDLPPPGQLSGLGNRPGTIATTDAADPRRQDNSFWMLFGSNPSETSDPYVSIALGVDTTMDDENGDSFPDTADAFGDVSVGRVLEIIENAPKPEDLLKPEEVLDTVFPLPGDNVDGAITLYKADRQTTDDNAECVIAQADMEPYRLLYLSGPGGSVIDDEAHIMIDLGGDDTYTAEVAGPGAFCSDVQVSVVEGFLLARQDPAEVVSDGSLLIELGGADHYDTPSMSDTQGAVRPRQVVDRDLPSAVNGHSVSLLFELQGNDTYEAAERSQGAAMAFGGGYGALGATQSAAWLIDVSGDDQYFSEADSQGFVGGSQFVGALVDLGGDDEYEFGSQARVVFDSEGTSFSQQRQQYLHITPTGLLYDRDGRDTYRSNQLLESDPETLGPDDDQWYVDQGWLNPKAWLGLGRPLAAFIDEGSHGDSYLRLVNDNPVTYKNISAIKNNRVREDLTSQDADAAPVNSGDPAGPMTEYPGVPRKVPAKGNFIDGLTRGYSSDDEDGDGASNLHETLAGTDVGSSGDHAGTVWHDPIGLDGNEPWFHIRSILGTGKGGFFIGGQADGEYTAGAYDFLVDLGGDEHYTNPLTGSGIFQYDVGGGDDRYEPTGAGPNLGAPALGIAVLADDGGSNRFTSSGAKTQGAALLGEVGILVTYNGTNKFNASASNVAQGAANGGGYAVLANFGGGQDEYLMTGTGIAQGAASGAGQAILIDGGGDNTFTALDAAGSQGAGNLQGSFAMLWSGDGNDRYIAGSGSQGSGRVGGAGILLDTGGDDTHKANQQAQGSGVSGGTGGSSGGTGWLVDLGGYDRYEAVAMAQGHVSGATSTGALFDLHGDDRYDSEGAGQGWMESGCGIALLLDTAGNDAYPTAVRDRTPVKGSPDAAGNNWIWGQTGCSTALGVDDSNLQAAMLRLTQITDTVQLAFISGNAPLGDLTTTAGKTQLTLRATIQGSNPSNIRRVTFFLEDEVLATGTYNPAASGSNNLAYDHKFVFPAAQFPDGDYDFQAVAHGEPTPNDGNLVGTPESPGRESPTKTLKIDNAPVSLSPIEVLGGIISPGRDAVLGLEISADRAVPAGTQAWAGCADAAKPPGARIVVTAIGTSTTYPAFNGYCPAGAVDIPLQSIALAQAGAWEDGVYDLEIRLTDAAGQVTTTKLLAAVRVDTEAPTSQVEVDYSGISLRNGSNIKIPIRADDGDGAGIERVIILLYDQAGNLDSIQHSFSDSPVIEVLAQHGDEFKLLTIAIDDAGNTESPCAAGQTPNFGKTCYATKAVGQGLSTVGADFALPVLGDVSATRRFVRPGGIIDYAAEAEDSDSGVEAVRLRFLDANGNPTYEVDMTSSPGGNYAANRVFPTESTDAETQLIYEIVARDAADNVASHRDVAVLDDRAPRVSVTGTDYFKIIGTDYEDPRSAGAPGQHVRVKLHLQDAPGYPIQESIESVLIDTSPLNGSSEPHLEACQPNLSTRLEGDWTCTFEFASNVIDEIHGLPIIATDKAGNQNLTQEAHVVVSAKPLPINDLQVIDTTHEGFKVTWTTKLASDSAIAYGRAPPAAGGQPSNIMEGPPGFRTEHELTLTGLSPSTTYYFQALSENDDGVRSNSTCTPAFCPSVTTLHSYTFDVTGPLSGSHHQGELPIGFNIGFRGGTKPVTVEFQIQDAAQEASPRRLADPFQQPEGTGSLVVNTTQVPDGEYIIHADFDRLGDPARYTSPRFWIDNTRPIVMLATAGAGARTGDSTPALEFVVLDPGGGQALADSIRMKVDNVTHPITLEENEVLFADSTRYRVVAAQPMTHGLHQIEISIKDASQNVGKVNMDLFVDLRLPVLSKMNITPSPGPVNARPGGTVEIMVHVDDDSEVASVEMGASAVRASTISLLKIGGHQWKATVAIPENVADGTYMLPLRATDAVGNTAETTLPVTVDARRAQVVQSGVKNIDYVDAEIRVTTNEPTQVRAAKTTLWTAWDTAHEITVSSLKPGIEQVVEIDIVDAAGWTSMLRLNVTTRNDFERPGPITNLSGASPGQGIVELTWNEATDNAGIQHYMIHRAQTIRAPAMTANVTAPRFMDEDAPAGRAVTYSVSAVDVGGNQGPERPLTIDVLALPHLGNATITPERGPASQPFTVTITYTHPSGQPPHAIHLKTPDQTIPMTPVPGTKECHLGCAYAAEMRLEPTSHLGDRGRISVVADDGRSQIQYDLEELPLVLRSGVQDLGGKAGHESPGLPLWTILLISILLAKQRIVSRRRDP